MKTGEGLQEKWPEVAHSVFWAERVTAQESTGYSPFYLAHGVEPVLPFDIVYATYMLPEVNRIISTAELLSIQARQLRMREEDLEMAKQKVL